MRKKIEEKHLGEKNDDDDDEKSEEEKKKLKEDLAKAKYEDEKLLSEPEMEKPKPLAKFNSTLVLEKLRNNALKMRKRPGIYLIAF